MRAKQGAHPLPHAAGRGGAGDTHLWVWFDSDDQSGVEKDVQGVDADGNSEGRLHVLEAVEDPERAECYQDRGGRAPDGSQPDVHDGVPVHRVGRTHECCRPRERTGVPAPSECRNKGTNIRKLML